MELSDETSRSESSVSLGVGGGGSLSGTAVKAGDFLEKNTSCHSGVAGRKPTPMGSSSSRWVGNTWVWQMQESSWVRDRALAPTILGRK